MQEESTTQDASVLDSNSVAPATAPETTAPAVVRDDQLEALRNEFADLRERVAHLPDPDTIVKQVVGHPSLKQSQRDMIAFQLREQREQEVEKRTADVDEMEAAGEIDPAVAEKRRQAIEKQVKQEYAQRLNTELAAAQQSPTTEQARQPRRPTEQELKQVWADQTLRAHGMIFPDVTAEMQAYLNKHPGSNIVPDAVFLEIVAQKNAAKNNAKMRAEAIREVESQAQIVRDADREGAGAPPIGGNSTRGDPVERLSQLNGLKRRLTPEERVERTKLMEKLSATS